MQNITAEKLKADAARLGFHRRPMDDLERIVKSSITDEYQSHLSQLTAKRGKLGEKLNKINDVLQSTIIRMGETLIDSGALMMAFVGLTIVTALFFIGYSESLTTAVVYVCLSMSGAVFVKVNPASADFWKPVLFIGLSILIGAMQAQISYDQGYGILMSMIYGVSLATMVYLLNETLFRSIQSLKGQMTAIWFRIKNAYLGVRKVGISKSIIKIDKRIESTSKKKELDILRSLSNLNYEYKLAELASNFGKDNKNLEHFQLNRKDVKYAN